MGAFYAQGRLTSMKQTVVTGTFVSNYFDMGINVPEIYQVPTMADNLPLGMIGMYPILFFSFSFYSMAAMLPPVSKRVMSTPADRLIFLI